MFLSVITTSTPEFLLLIASLYILYIFIQAALDPLRDVPGPFFTRFTRLWYLGTIYNGEFELVNIALHRKYGPIVRIAPNEYSIDDLDSAKIIYGHGSNFIKAPWYLAWTSPDPQKSSLFADIDLHHHRNQRRKFASAYSMSSLVGYEPFINNCTDLFKARLSELATVGCKVNFAHWFQCYAFDVIGEVTFGQRFGFLDSSINTSNVFEAIDTRTSYSTFVGVFSTLHYILFRLLPSTGGHGYVGKYTSDQIQAREKLLKGLDGKECDGPSDFVSKFLQIFEETPEKMTKIDLFTICQSNVGAGSDTTAISLSSILYHLLKHPKTYKRLQEEIDASATEGRISDPITFKEAQQLPYLQAVIKEALRLHSATGLPLARVVPKSGITLAGKPFPAGATVGINSWVAHRNTSVFGPDACAWRPERWLEIEQEGRGSDVERYFFAFGMGSRTCIGKNLSILEISKLIPQLLRTFEFTLDTELQYTEWKTQSRWFVKPTKFYGKVSLRQRTVSEKEVAKLCM